MSVPSTRESQKLPVSQVTRGPGAPRAESAREDFLFSLFYFFFLISISPGPVRAWSCTNEDTI
jgi:hypothetical protein